MTTSSKSSVISSHIGTQGFQGEARSTVLR